MDLSIPTNSSTIQWQAVRERTALDNDDVHLWLIDLDQIHGAEEDLLPSELPRLEKIQGAIQRGRYVATRISVRKILALYLQIPCSLVTITHTDSGKPRLDAEKHFLHFNLSHCGNLCLLAVSHSVELGIDLEAIRPVPNLRGIARRVFSPEVAEHLASYQDKDAEHRFFEHWTRMEATQKALARGIFSSKVDMKKMGLFSLVPRSGYIATLAWTDPTLTPNLRYYEFKSRTK